MKLPNKVAASILCADFNNLGCEIEKCQKAGCDMIHVDVMDGHFVPVLTIGPLIIKAVRPLTNLEIEAHLMIENPSYHIDSYLDAGADIISLHAECYGTRRDFCKGFWQFPKEVDNIDAEKILKDIAKIKSRGKKVYVVLNPGTPVCVEEILNNIDGVLVMSVNPGFSGQKFIADVLPKIEYLRKIFNKDIAIDGGINQDTSVLAAKAGVNVFVTASYFFGAKDQVKVVEHLKYLKDGS